MSFQHMPFETFLRIERLTTMKRTKWYHGTNLASANAIKRDGIDVTYNEDSDLDFGPGFYLTYEENQAIKFAKSRSKKAGFKVPDEAKIPVVMEFEFIIQDFRESIKFLDEFNIEWGKVVLKNRIEEYNPEIDDKWPLIFGRVADGRNFWSSIMKFEEDGDVESFVQRNTNTDFMKDNQLVIKNQEICDKLVLNHVKEEI